MSYVSKTKFCNNLLLVWTQRWFTLDIISLWVSISIFRRKGSIWTKFNRISLPRTNRGILNEKSVFDKREKRLLSLVAKLSYIFPHCSQIIFVNRPERNYTTILILISTENLNLSSGNYHGAEDEVWQHHQPCTALCQSANNLFWPTFESFLFTWNADRIFAGFSTRFTLSYTSTVLVP